MEVTTFEQLKSHYKSHKKAAAAIGLSYSRYNEWRWDPKVIPAYGKRLLELALEKIQQITKS